MTKRYTYLIGFVTVFLLLLASFYLQFFDGIMPCPLCALQRATFILLGISFFIGILLASKFWGRIIINSLSALFSVLGMFLAGRQIWLQTFPSPNSTECGVSLQYMYQILPLNEVIKKIFQGSAECTQRGWEFLHLNMAEWALIWFIIFFFMSIYMFLKEFKYESH